MTEAELERFQTLLENVPEYRTELRQSLEVRSLLHDDALNLKPPADLSEHIRIAVGASFEADAIVEQQEQRARRGLFIAPLRISAGVLAACCLLVGVAFSPTLPHLATGSSGTAPVASALSGGSSSGEVASSEAVSSETDSVGGSTLASAAMPMITPSSIRAALHHGASEDVAHENASRDVASSVDPAEDYMALLGHEVAEHPMSPVVRQDDHGSINIARLDPSEVLRKPTSSRPNPEILTHDPAELLNRGALPLVSYNPSSDSVMGRSSEPGIAQAQPGVLPGQAVPGNRTLTIGVTLGAGQVAANKTPTVLLQNSYYFSFSVSGNDRIGVEMGASAFQQEQASSSDPVTPPGSYAKGSAGMPTEDAPHSTAPSPSPTPNPVPNPPKDQRIEAQITYGAVFYDRRIRLSKTWDLCGRLAVGAADDAFIGNFRAYAAYTIPSKGVTLTMGVGGSALQSLTTKETVNSSVNYGIYYGVETGF
jgi:hypothetical protein